MASVALVRRSLLVHALLVGALVVSVPAWRLSPGADAGPSALAAGVSSPADLRRLTSGERTRALERIGGVPLHFERNVGQAPDGLDFIGTGAGYRVALTAGGARVALADHGQATHAFRFSLEGARSDARAEVLDTQRGVVSYYKGNRPEAWQRGVSTHARVRYAQVYDGIDIVYYGNQRRLQYDFIVAPGRDPGTIGVRIDGADRLSLASNGDLLIHAGTRVLTHERPFTYQTIDGTQVEVPSRFVLDDGVVRFEVGEYDRTRELVIDPVIAYASWLGGQSEEAILDLAVDGSGNLVVFGAVQDAAGLVDYPTTPGAVKGARAGANDFDAFVSKFNSSGTALIFSTLLGGSDYEVWGAYAYDGAMAVDAAGNVHLTGTTQSGDFPTTAGAFDTSYNSNPRPNNIADGFYVKLAPSGALLYGTYFGGRAAEEPHGIDVDAAGNAYIVGETSSTTTNDPLVGGFTLTGDAYDTTLQNTEAFLLRFSAGGALTYATYIGGSSSDAQDSTDVKVSRTTANVVYVIGDTRSNNLFPGGLTPALPSSNSGTRDGFVLRLDLTSSGAAQATYGSYLGGTGEDRFAAMVLDASDRIYIVGTTSSSSATFPQAVTLPGSIAPPGGDDVLVAKFDPAISGASSLVFGARINGFYTDTGYDIAVDSQNQPWIGVSTGSLSPTPNAAQDFPVVNPVQNTRSGNGVHQMVVQLNAAGTALLMSSPIGGNAGRGGPVALAITASDEVWVGGTSSGSTDRLTTVTPFQGNYGGGDADATLQRIGFQADLTITKTVNKPYPQFNVLPGESLVYTIVVNNATGDTARNLTVTDNLPSEVVFVSCSTTVGACGGSGNNRTISIPSLAPGAQATITINTTVAPTVQQGQVWTNTATIGSSTTTDPNPGNNTGGIGNGAPTLTDPALDADGDGLSNGFETAYGLNGLNGGAGSGASDDPDGDGKTNLQEQAEGTHPRGFVITYLAEGATSSFFDTRLALANPTATQALVLTRFQKEDGTTVREYTVIPPFSRRTLDVKGLAGMSNAAFSTLVEADVQVVADRTMTWDGTGYGSHAERGILTRSATRWYFAEGATSGNFELFYLIQNPNAQAAQVQVTYLLPAGAPLVKTYTVQGGSRFNIWVDDEGATDPALSALRDTALSAILESTNGVPIIAERAMYLNQPGQIYGAGHESAGVTAPATQWFLAEGATGNFFDLFILIANPDTRTAQVRAEYLLESGQVITKDYTVGPSSRFNIWVDLEDAALASAALSTRVTATNGVPIIVERAMWWPGTPDTWYEAHNSPGETSTGTRWAMAEGEVGGPRGNETYMLIANTSPFAGTARVTVLFEDGTAPVTRDFALNPSSRKNVVPVDDFPETVGKRFGLLIESIGGTPAQIVVERAMYASTGGVFWAAGSNALATRLP